MASSLYKLNKECLIGQQCSLFSGLDGLAGQGEEGTNQVKKKKNKNKQDVKTEGNRLF